MRGSYIASAGSFPASDLAMVLSLSGVAGCKFDFEMEEGGRKRLELKSRDDEPVMIQVLESKVRVVRVAEVRDAEHSSICACPWCDRVIPGSSSSANATQTEPSFFSFSPPRLSRVFACWTRCTTYQEPVHLFRSNSVTCPLGALSGRNPEPAQSCI
jgi:hypothetical protein